MKQVLRIFAKDVRHQRIEILVSLAFTALLAFTYHKRWEASPYGDAVSFSPGGLLGSLPYLLTLIVPLSWWLLISTAVHEEKLVGDRQFWVARPYEWTRLLTAKVLFLITFACIPLLLAQCFMLSRAGFPATHYLLPILLNLLFLTCLLVLPQVAVASLTKNLGQMALTLLGVAVCFIVVQLLAQYLPEDRVAIPYVDSLGAAILIGLCLSIIAVQYARRKTRTSWILLAVALAVVFGTSAMDGAPDDASINKKYSPKSPAPGVQFRYQEDEKDGVGPSAFVARTNSRIGVYIPVHVSGVANGTIETPEFLKVTLEAPGGPRWTSVWQSISMERFFPAEEKTAAARFTMPRAVYDRFEGKPLNVKIAFAMTQANAVNVIRLPLGTRDFTVPGLGICTPLTGFWNGPRKSAGWHAARPCSSQI